MLNIKTKFLGAVQQTMKDSKISSLEDMATEYIQVAGYESYFLECLSHVISIYCISAVRTDDMARYVMAISVGCRMYASVVLLCSIAR